MDYFVNVENSPGQQWQAELLIESFKQQQLEESLVVGLSMTNIPPKGEFCRNLYSHCRIHSIANIGEVRGFDRLNWLYSMSNMLRSGSLKQPFVSIETNSVLFKPVAIDRQKEVPHVVFQVNPFFTLESVEEYIPTIKKHLKSADWVPLGSTIYFNNIPQGYFDRAVYLTEVLAYEQLRAGKEIWRHTDRVAWVINILEMMGRCVIEGRYDFEMTMMDHGQSHNFINYERGAPPHFSKSMFQFLPPAMLSFGNPLDILAGLNEEVGTSSVQYVSDLAKYCLVA
jgi:hypothetical protein